MASIVLACFDQAIQCDIYAGDGSLEEITGESSAKLPKVRNDHEFVMTMRVYMEQEGIV